MRAMVENAHSNENRTAADYASVVHFASVSQTIKQLYAN